MKHAELIFTARNYKQTKLKKNQEAYFCGQSNTFYRVTVCFRGAQILGEGGRGQVALAKNVCPEAPNM